MNTPDTELDGTAGARRLRPQSGKYLVLLFYQEDATPTCTTELVSFREDFDLIAGLGGEVVGISTDDLGSHVAFLDRLGGLPFPLLTDHDGGVARSLGAWNTSTGRATRSVFVVDREGTIVHQSCPYNPSDLTEYEKIFRAIGFSE